jgi:malate dehydrogenase (quinone)
LREGRECDGCKFQGAVLESPDERFAALRVFYPNAKQEDWKAEVAGQCVQIIKKDPTRGGILQFGTELVMAADRSIVAMRAGARGDGGDIEHQ